MNNSKKAESLVWIIIWVFILSIVLLGIINIISYNEDLITEFEKGIYSYLLISNWDNIVKQLDTTWVLYNEDFYIYKDTINKTMTIMTWSANEEYAYVDIFWNKTDKDVNIWWTYKRTFTNKTDVLRHKITPDEIDNLVLHFDAHNVDWSDNSTISNLDTIQTWIDLSWNNNDWTQSNSNNQPIFTSTWITYNPFLVFDWDKMFEINDSDDLNTDSTYEQKSIAVVFKAWFEVNNFQSIYEQWNEDKWYWIQINDWHLYAWVWNNTWDSWHQYKYVDMWEVVQDSVYFVVLTQCSKYPDDSNNILRIYLNWELEDVIDHVDPQTSHTWNNWLWAIHHYWYNLYDSSPITTANYTNFFEWWGIWEFIIWNNTLTENEIRWLNNYFSEKWLNTQENIIYDIITNTTIKYIPNPN